ncbi:hypothetical protein [Methylorubrum thiocyanatum]
MSDTRISAADLLRLAAIASVSPEGTADEVVAILQRTGPSEASTAEVDSAPAISADAISAASITAGQIRVIDDADSDKLAKPE